MTELYQAWLHKNQFTGAIPDLSQCKSLFDLQLRDNQLTGVVPDSLMRLSSLKNVSLDNNELQGPVPVFGKGVTFTIDGINSFCLDTPGDCDPGLWFCFRLLRGLGILFGWRIRGRGMTLVMVGAMLCVLRGRLLL